MPKRNRSCQGRKSHSALGTVRPLLALAGAMLAFPIPSATPADIPDPIAPVPAPEPADPARLRLGKRLFRDRQLSHDGSRACVTCHDLAGNGADNQKHALGADGRPLDYNIPTVFNAALSFRLTWRGRFRSLEEFTEAVLLDPRLMATTWSELITRLRADPTYRADFAAAYGTLPGRVQVLDALGEFQRSLITQDAPFDRFLRGERDALSPEQAYGWALFKDYGCVACHQGVNVGGNLFQRFGIFAERAVLTPADLGRFTLTGLERDRFVFRVPSLRNVALTAPYFHDGSAPTLAEAVQTMARSQIGRTLTDHEVEAIVAFLHSLTGAGRAPAAAP